MPLTLHAQLKEPFAQAFPEVVYMAEVHVTASLVYRFLDGRSSVFSYPMSLEKVTPVKTEYDPFTKRLTISQLSIRLRMDPLVEKMYVGNRLRGRKLMLKLGAAGAEEANYIPDFNGIIEDARPVDNGSRLLIKATDAAGAAFDKKVVGYWHSQHPRETMANLFGSTKLSIPAALLNSASFAYDFDTADSHLVISRGNAAVGYTTADLAVRVPVKGSDIIWGKLLPMLGGNIVVGGDGLITYVPFDETAAAVAVIEDEEIVDLEQVDTVGRIINRISIRSHPDWTGQDGGEFSPSGGGIVFTLDDTASQADHFYPGTTDTGIFEESLDLDWVQGVGRLEFAISSNTPGEGIIVKGAMTHGMCGTRAFQSQPANAKVTIARPAYLKIDNEIIKCVNDQGNSGVDPSFAADPAIISPSDGIRYHNLIANRIRYDYASGGRGQFGTTPAAHAYNAKVFDVTIPVLRAQQILKRWSRGAPVVRVSLRGLRRYAVKAGELVSLVTSRYKAFGRSSLGTETKFEVVEKQYDRDRHMLMLTLVRATETSAPATVEALKPAYTLAQYSRGIFEQATLVAMRNGDVGQKFVQQGLSVSQVSGLTAALSAGVASGLMMRQSWDEASQYVLTASKDTYFRMDLQSGQIRLYEVANGGAEPVLDDTEVRIAKVVTNASAITSIVDMRPTKALLGAKMAQQGSHNLLDNAAFDQGPAGWTLDTDADIISDPANARSGNWVLNMPAFGGGSAENGYRFKAREGDQFYAEAWMKGASGFGALQIRWYSASGAVVSTVIVEKKNLTASYALFSGQLTAPANSAHGALLVTAGNLSNPFYCDDCVVNMVQNTSQLADSAVVAGKLADAAVTYQHLTLPAQLGSGGLFNTNVIKRST